MDPLRVVREVVMKDELQSVRVEGDNIHFGDRFSLPRKTETSYKSQRGRGDFYNLESLVYYMQYGQNARLAEYLQEANKRRLMPVSFIDRQDLVNYLTGVTEHSESIQVDVPTLPLNPTSMEAVMTDSNNDLKRAATEEPVDESAHPAKMRTILQEEVLLKDRNSILKCSNKTFNGVLEILNNLPKHKNKPSATAEPQAAHGKDHRRDGSKHPEHKSSHPPGTSGKGAPPGPPAQSQGSPIIIVPSGFSDGILLNMYNAAEFLQDGKFQPWEQLQEAGMKKPDVVSIKRTIGREGKKPARYHITDKPPKKPEDWKRVVAVFCHSAKWQFKDYPFPGAKDGDLVATFHKVKGFHLHYHDSPVHKLIKTWNVQPITLHRNARHNDAPQAGAIWKALDSHLASRNSSLKY